VHKNSTVDFVTSLDGFRAVGYDGVVGSSSDMWIEREQNNTTDYTADKLDNKEVAIANSANFIETINASAA
jgi:hypothetical protein